MIASAAVAADYTGPRRAHYGNGVPTYGSPRWLLVCEPYRTQDRYRKKVTDPVDGRRREAPRYENRWER